MQYSNQNTQQYPAQTNIQYVPQVQTVQYAPTTQYVALKADVNPRFGFGSVLALAICQLILGAVIIVLQAIIIPHVISIAATGIWMGILYLITGILGILCWRRKSPGLLRGFMVFSIINSVFASGLIIVAAIDAVLAAIFSHYYQDYNSRVHYSVAAAMSVLAFVEVVIAIVSSAMACYGVCTCCFGSQTAQPVQYVNTPNGPQLVMVPTNPTNVVIMQNQQQPDQVMHAGAPPAYSENTYDYIKE